MTNKKQTIRNLDLFQFASMKRSLMVYLPGFCFKHDDSSEGKDRFVGRDVQFRRLFAWLTSTSKSGSYLITGYRGMGKSLLVKRVIQAITRKPRAYKEVLFQLAMVCCFTAFLCLFAFKIIPAFVVLLLVAFGLVLFLYISKVCNGIKFEHRINKVPYHHLFDKEMINKFLFFKEDGRYREYNRLDISINLGQEVLAERDVLSLLACNIKESYGKFVKNRQNRPFISFLEVLLITAITCALAKYIVIPGLRVLGASAIMGLKSTYSEFWSITKKILEYLQIANKNDNRFAHILLYILLYAGSLLLVVRSAKRFLKYIPYFSIPHNALKRIEDLIDRINATIHEENGINSQPDNGLISISIFNQKVNKVRPMAGVREIELELMNIINDISSEDCPKPYRVQLILVFDELDKISKASDKPLNQDKPSDDNPEFETSVKGFTDAMAYEERKQNVLRLLANMKMFITSVHAKCVFISGHELFDASMADLSDREFAISSIFNGVLNVCSFLSPEREQTDVSSMTEVYLATMLLPDKFIADRMNDNARDHAVLKEELPSLKWYNEYLMRVHILDEKLTLTQDEIRKREEDIRFAVEFMRYFTVFLAHISNGSPKKISAYFEKYVKLFYDVNQQLDWGDIITVGIPTEKRLKDQCVIYFNSTDQKLINFIFYIAMPVMNAITNEVSNYGDKLLVSSSFILDQIYKYHGRGFSWRNLELMPELLNSNKNPELRDSMASIIEFLLQVHITNITSGIYQYKFHKQISEEISALSKISEEASAIFNFTLNESETVKRYNTRLLNHYLTLAERTKDKSKYGNILERIHENLGDIYFSEEDFYRAVHEYKCSLNYITNTRKNIESKDILHYLKCSLKIGLSYENRRTYANAYMMYCNIINQLSHIREFNYKNIGLDSTMRLTNDWRNKQIVYTNGDAAGKDVFRKQFNRGLWDVDCIKKKPQRFQYSLDCDKSISGFSQLYSAEKSDIFMKLTAFEDVKFVYQPILAKLFVIEKMEVGGITQSSIDQAEAEFNALHSSTNLQEKFMVSADFFGKMAQILYYKNNFVSTSPLKRLSATLYNFDVNVWSLLDDFCFSECKDNKNDAIQVKDNINKFFDTLYYNSDMFIKDFKFIKLYDYYKPNFLTDDPKEIEKRILFQKHVTKYLEFLDKHLKQDICNKILRITSCPERRKILSKEGYRLPCNACKYANRSLIILMNEMFAEKADSDNQKSKVLQLLLNTSHKHLRHIRPNQVALLADAAVRMADIMLSCSHLNQELMKDEKEDGKGKEKRKGKKEELYYFTDEALDLLFFLSSKTVDENLRKDKIGKFNSEISKLDRSVLYYWAAYRYYEIASKHKEAVFCLNRIAKVFEDYLRIVVFHSTYFKKDTSEIVSDTIIEILDNLFSQASRTLGAQYDHLNMAEIHEYKWLFHLGYADDMDLTKLTIFPDLQSMFISIANSKLFIYKYNNEIGKYNDYLVKIYPRVSPPLKHEMTFKGEIESCFMKAHVNRLALYNLLNENNIIIDRKKLAEATPNSEESNYLMSFFSMFESFLSSVTPNAYQTPILGLFKSDNYVKSKFEIIEFLIDDSMVSLSYILKTLTPHNHFTTFSNSYIAEVYDLLWEWSKYYEMLYNIYAFYRYKEEEDSVNLQALLSMMQRNSMVDTIQLNELLNKIIKIMADNDIPCKDNYGYLYNKLFASVRHEMDDSTIHHIYTNYSAEMAIKYYMNARSINSEGVEYKNLINGMYILDDDLKNDTCQSNLADERFMHNSGIWDTKRKWFQQMYRDSNINNIECFESLPKPAHFGHTYTTLSNRYKDSKYLNSEY